VRTVNAKRERDSESIVIVSYFPNQLKSDDTLPSRHLFFFVNDIIFFGPFISIFCDEKIPQYASALKKILLLNEFIYTVSTYFGNCS